MSTFFLCQTAKTTVLQIPGSDRSVCVWRGGVRWTVGGPRPCSWLGNSGRSPTFLAMTGECTSYPQLCLEGLCIKKSCEAGERKGGERKRERAEGWRRVGRGEATAGWGPWCTMWAKKLPASQPLHVWPGTALSSLFWGLSKAHHDKEAVATGMLQGCQGPVGGGRGDKPETLHATLGIMSTNILILVAPLLLWQK